MLLLSSLLLLKLLIQKALSSKQLIYKILNPNIYTAIVSSNNNSFYYTNYNSLINNFGIPLLVKNIRSNHNKGNI